MQVPSPSGGGLGWGKLRAPQPLDLATKMRQHGSNISQHIIVPIPKDADARRLQKSRSSEIVTQLFVVIVLPTIQLNRKAQLQAVEIEDERLHDVLATKANP